MCSWLRSKLVYYVTAFAPMWTDQRFLALRMGGHVLSRHFRYYVPEVSGQGTVQTPVVVRWVLIPLLYCIWYFVVPVSCIFVADGYCCVLDGLVCMVLLRWVVFITMVSVSLMLAEFLHVHDNCFHQIGMIASIKLRHPLSFCRANCAKTVVLVCVCLVF